MSAIDVIENAIETLLERRGGVYDRNTVDELLDSIHAAATTERQEFMLEIATLQNLLDMRDREYFFFCETGSIDGSKLTTNITP